MKKTLRFRFLFVLFAATAALGIAKAQVQPVSFFNDTFGNGSTVDSPTPTPPWTNYTSYEVIASKAWAPTSTVAPNDLKFGIGSSSGGTEEIQALFATNAVTLTAPGTDYINLIIVFTNTSGGLLTTAQGYIGFGLYNSELSTNYPVPGGLNNLATTSASGNSIGNAQNWQGYWAELAYNGANQGNVIETRPAQDGTSTPANNDQDLVTMGSSSQSFSNPKGGTVGSVQSPAQSIILATNGTYTELLSIQLDFQGSLAITNSLYSGVGTNGTAIAQYGGIATNTTFLTSAFNALAMGFYQKTAGPSNLVDIASINVSGYSTPVSGPPTITSQPSPTLVATNGSCAFFVSANGFNVSYQWHRNGTNLIDSGNISGSQSGQLVISPASNADAFSGPNGYYATVTGAGGYSTNSTTNSLTLVPATNLTWDVNGGQWDVDTTTSWVDTNGNPEVFTFGDPVTIDDTAGGGGVFLAGSYISSPSVIVNSSLSYTIEGSGSLAGPGSLIYKGSGRLSLDANNSYTGGTIVSNASAYVYLETYGGLGDGPLTFGEAGGQMEIVPAGSGSTGIVGPIVVADNFTVIADTAPQFGAVFLNDMSGTSGKTLTIQPGATNTTLTTRIRAYGNNTTYNANLNLSSSQILFASYSSAGSQTYNGVISGPGSFMQKGTITTFNGANTYTGGAIPAQGDIGLGISSAGNPVTSGPIGTGPLYLAADGNTTGNGMIFAAANNINLANPIECPSGTNNLTLQIGGTNNLTLSGPFTLYGNDGLPNTLPWRTIQVTNTALTVLSGVISDGGSNYGFNVTGSGVLALNNTEAYGGPTTNSGGTLLVNGEITNSRVIVATNATLGGIGTITGPVTILNGGALAPGNQTTAGVQGIGNLTINNLLTFQAGSTNFVVVNNTANTSDAVTVNSVTYAGTLVVTNILGTPTVSSSFTIFNATTHSGNFSAITGTPGPGLGWSFNPANGVLSVVSVTPPPFTVAPKIQSITLSGSNVILSGTNAQSGAIYYLLTSTNLLVPVKNWLPVSTNIASGANAFTFTATNAIIAHDAQQFYIFSNTNN